MRSSRFRNGLPAATAVAAAAIMLLKLTGCGGSDDDTPPGTKPPPVDTPDSGPDAVGPNGPLTIAPGPSRGSAIAISPDDSVVVSVNRDSSSVSVFKTTFPDDGTPAKLTKTAEVAVGAEPWQVVIGPDGDTAYVVVRKDQKLVKIAGLKSTPAVAGTAAVGSEPTAVALTPGGTRAWVANWVDGTLTGVDTKAMEAKSTVDLNAALVATGLVGDVKARPSLAHPRSLAITNNLDQNEDDESIYVTEYFAQRTEKEADNGANADVAKSGLVYKVKLADKSVSAIKLAALTDLGFKDSNGGTAGCYPNQLQSITIQDKFAYVSSICASPKGPVGAVTTVAPPDVSNIKTTTHGVVSVIDLSSDKEVPASTASLMAKFDQAYVKKAVADDNTRRYAGVPADIGFVKGGAVAYVVSNAADSVFRVQYDPSAASAIAEVGAPSNMFINLNPSGIAADKSGQNPIGIAMPNVDAHKKFAFVANDVTRNVSVIDFNTQAVAGGAATPSVEASSAMPAAGSQEEAVRKGKRFFNTATGRWALKGQGWNGCQSCHMDGLTDNVTWFFARGPRQSTSLDGSYSKKDPNDQRLFNWSAINDEVSDFEGNTRGISGGVGAIVSDKTLDVANRITNASHAALNGSSDQLADVGNPLALTAPSVLDDWANITAYVKTVRSPKKPSNLDATKVAAGKALFVNDGSCNGCHGGDKWTISTRFYTPATDATDGLLAKDWTPPAGFPAALLPASDPGSRFMRFGNGNPAAFDQIQCIIRPVGTFAKADAVMGQVVEKRQDMATAAQGNQANSNGFNPPSLLGVQIGAPFLHSGGASTLESLFSPTFTEHYGTLAPNFLKETDPTERAAKVDQLVQYLLSIDNDAPVVTIPTAGAGGGNFCSQ